MIKFQIIFLKGGGYFWSFVSLTFVKIPKFTKNQSQKQLLLISYMEELYERTVLSVNFRNQQSSDKTKELVFECHL